MNAASPDGRMPPPSLDPALEETLHREGQPRTFRPGQALFLEGDPSERVLVLEQGWVLISCISTTGRETVLGLCGAGDLLGEVSALDGQPRSATAVALTQTQARVVSASVLRHAAREGETAAALLRLLAYRLRQADRRRVEFAALDTLGRVSSRVLELCERFGRPDGSSVLIELPLSQEQLASWCAASREATVKALATLRSLGCISTARRRIVVHDVAALQRHAAVLR